MDTVLTVRNYQLLSIISSFCHAPLGPDPSIEILIIPKFEGSWFSGLNLYGISDINSLPVNDEL
jgi:hypothetical protein